MFIISEKEDR